MDIIAAEGLSKRYELGGETVTALVLGFRSARADETSALTTRGVSIALSAGAGCGKTFVLTERFLREIAPDDEVIEQDRFLRREVAKHCATADTGRAGDLVDRRIRVPLTDKEFQPRLCDARPRLFGLPIANRSFRHDA